MEAPSPQPLCPRHPDQPVIDVCARCGGFVCVLDRVLVERKPFCSTCAAHPEVNYLEAFRLQFWGKRDGWAWLLGAGGVMSLAGVVAMSATKMRLAEILPSVVAAAVGVCFWFGLRWARYAIVLVPVLAGAVGMAQAGPVALAPVAVPFLIALAIVNDTRNKLFFKVDVSPVALKRAWNLYANNTIARTGFILSLLGLPAFPLAPVALICSIAGLRRVNPKAHPPIGRKGQAIAGIVFGSIGTLILLAVAIRMAIDGWPWRR